MIGLNGDGTETVLDSDEPMGLAGLLRGWRREAGLRLGRGKSLTMAEVAHAVGMSERWYRELERGAVYRISPEFFQPLADVLQLTPGERLALYHYTPGGALMARTSPGADPVPEGMRQLFLDVFMPYPAFLFDADWGIRGFNSAMADWCPWVAEPGANLMRWMLSAEARSLFVDWEEHARNHLAMLRLELVRRPGNRALASLLADVQEDPVCHQLWLERPRVVAHRDGARYRVRLPYFDRREIDVVSYVGSAASRPDLQTAVIAWGGQEELPPLPDRSADAVCAGAPDVPPAAVETSGVVAVELPALSARAGLGHNLTLHPRSATRPATVTWKRPGETDHLPVAAALPKVLPTVLPDPAAAREYELLLRQSLPPDEQEARVSLDGTIRDLAARLRLAQELRRAMDTHAAH
ncbi:helix-turn-helix domain protein [Actinobacteria bacterium OK074]|nr:helix-turn-helix domain protein [Actinobacteria bacterium OK074]